MLARGRAEVPYRTAGHQLAIPVGREQLSAANTVRLASPSLHLLEQMIEGAAHFEFFRAALHVHDLTAAEVAADLLDRIDSNHGGAMDLPEFVGVELIDQIFDRLADQGLEPLSLHSSVFVLGAEEQDVAGRDHPYIGAYAGLYPTHVFAWFQAACPQP